MKIQKININKNHKVLLFDIGPNKKQGTPRGRTIMKMLYLITTKVGFRE